MKYSGKVYMAIIARALKQRPPGFSWLQEAIRRMDWRLARRKELLSKIQYLLGSSRPETVRCALEALKYNSKRLFKGTPVSFKRAWINRLNGLPAENEKNQILIIENMLLLGSDILRKRELKMLDDKNVAGRVDQLDKAILFDYLQDTKGRSREKIITLFFESKGPLLEQAVKEGKRQLAGQSKEWKLLSLIRKKISWDNSNKAVKLHLAPLADEGKIKGSIQDKDYLEQSSDPYLQYLMLALKYHGFTAGRTPGNIEIKDEKNYSILAKLNEEIRLRRPKKSRLGKLFT